MTRDGSERLRTRMLNVRLNDGKRALLWLILATLAAVLAYFAFRGYFSAEFLMNFSNAFSC
jgi:hypothetical protein